MWQRMSSAIGNISLYQAYILGTLHALSKPGFQAMKADELEQMRLIVDTKWREEMSE